MKAPRAPLILAFLLNAGRAPGAPLELGAPDATGYVPDNPFRDLLVAGTDATFDLWHHDPAAPGKCASRLELTFEVRNAGAASLKTAGLRLYWRTNPADESWPLRRPAFIKVSDLPKFPTGWANEFELPDEMTPGQAVKFSVRPALGQKLGRWHPFTLEARLGREESLREPCGYRYVGQQMPVRRAFDFHVPDVRYTAKSLRFPWGKPQGSRGEQVGAILSIESDGTPYRGPIRLTVQVPNDPAMVDPERAARGEIPKDNLKWNHRTFALFEELKDGVGAPQVVFMTPKLWDHKVFKREFHLRIALGCPQHQFGTDVTDADPSNHSVRGPLLEEAMGAQDPSPDAK